jgi:hypothetical protein
MASLNSPHLKYGALVKGRSGIEWVDYRRLKRRGFGAKDPDSSRRTTDDAEIIQSVRPSFDNGTLG